GRERGGAFGANRQAVRGVLDVRAGEGPAAGQHGGADVEVRVRTMGPSAGLAGRGEELVVVVHALHGNGEARETPAPRVGATRHGVPSTIPAQSLTNRMLWKLSAAPWATKCQEISLPMTSRKRLRKPVRLTLISAGSDPWTRGNSVSTSASWMVSASLGRSVTGLPLTSGYFSSVARR